MKAEIKMATTLRANPKTPRPARRITKKAPDFPKEVVRPIWETVAEIGSQIPDAEWEKVPDDSASNFRHYRHGAPKKSA